LPGNAQSLAFLVQSLNHPFGKININALLYLSGTKGFGQIGKVLDIDITIVKIFIEILSFHIPSTIEQIAPHRHFSPTSLALVKIMEARPADSLLPFRRFPTLQLLPGIGDEKENMDDL
jgi:hypothetical protein